MHLNAFGSRATPAAAGEHIQRFPETLARFTGKDKEGEKETGREGGMEEEGREEKGEKKTGKGKGVEVLTTIAKFCVR